MARFALFSRTIVVALGQTGTKLVQLAIVLLLVRIISPELWSKLAFLLSIYSAAIGIGGLNIHQGLYFFYGRLDPSERRRLAFQTSGLLAASGAVTAAVVASLDIFLHGGAFYVPGVFPLLALVLLLELPTQGIPQLLIATERPAASSAFNVVASLIQAACFMLPLLLGSPLVHVVYWLLGYAALRVIALFVVIFAMLPPGKLSIAWAPIREQIIYTAPLGLSIATSILNRNIDKWFVAAFDTANFGAYALAAQEVPFVSILPYSVGAVMATRIVLAFKNGDVERAQAYWQASISRITIVVIPMAIALVLCAPQLVELLYTEDYLIATLPFQIYSLILLHRVVEYGVMLRAAGDTRSLWWSSLTILGANVVLSLPLTLTIGMVGAAIGTLLANAIAWVYILRRIATALNTSLGRVFPWRSYGAVLALCAVLALGVAYVSDFLPAGAWVQLSLRAALFVGLYLATVFTFRIHKHFSPVPDDDEEMLRDLKT